MLSSLLIFLAEEKVLRSILAGIPEQPVESNAATHRPSAAGNGGHRCAQPSGPAGAISKIAQPLGVVGAIEVEASPWIEDNLWVLEVAGKDTIMVGTVRNLEPGKPEFPKLLDQLFDIFGEDWIRREPSQPQA